ncbi:MAG: 4Fe-4S binding protein [Candidatus Thermoplasmatota archaeon]
MVITIDHNKCDGNGACVESCPVGVIEVKNKKCTIVNPDECVDCGACVDACPNQAITLPEN